MSTNNLCWFHLSDFHTGKDQYAQLGLFESIIEHIDAKIKSGRKPDFIFISGDIANKGMKAEYEQFCYDFILPLCDLCKDTKIFMVPGNHDVDRDEARATKRYGVANEIPEFFDSSKEGLHERKVLFPRFENYAQAEMHGLIIPPNNWLFSEDGFFTHIHDKSGLKIGILGINTAWLSEGKHDRHHLTPGKSIIDAGLKKLEGCKVKIVLGHHSLDWFDEDVTPIRTLFGKKGVIYLHGHLHKSSGNPEFGGGRKFLTIQSGAAFQAREDDQWVNRLLWCDLDIRNEHVKIQPRQWSKANQEWSLDGLAYPEEYRTLGTDYWALPLKEIPQKSKAQTIKGVGGEDVSALPQGWFFIDKSFLDEKRRDLTNEDILSFFDGRVPSWSEALTLKIPRREIVNNIVNEMNNARLNDQPQLTLIMGAGGEGKSTVFFQTISDLAAYTHDWKILWLANPSRDILWPNRFINQLPRDDKTWIIASDDAGLIARYIFENAKSFRKAERRDIQFLLCCRDSDWLAADANQWPWKDYVIYIEKRMRGITLEDSEIIVRGWSQFGSKGLGNLSGLGFNEAVDRLFLASKTEEERYQDEGAFLGAMLRVRIGDELKLHVKSLLLRLKEREVNNETLMDAFAYIVAMHSEQVFILTKEILAEILTCKLRDVKRKITGPLGDEAAVSTGGDRIFTRHLAIAETAVEILSETFHVDFDELFLELAESAYRIHCNGLFLSYFVKWKFLSDHFMRKGKTSLAIRLDQALLKMDPSDSRLIVHLSRLLREASQPDLSIKVFRDIDHGIVGQVRSFYYEWGVAEGVNVNDGLAIWLFGVALSDQIELKPVEAKTAKMGLSGLAKNFWRLYELYNNQSFIQSCAAAVQIGLSFPKLNETDKRLFKHHKGETEAKGIKNVDIRTAFQILDRGITSAWEQREATLAKWIIPASELSFKRLAKLIKIEDI